MLYSQKLKDIQILRTCTKSIFICLSLYVHILCKNYRGVICKHINHIKKSRYWRLFK